MTWVLHRFLEEHTIHPRKKFKCRSRSLYQKDLKSRRTASRWSGEGTMNHSALDGVAKVPEPEWFKVQITLRKEAKVLPRRPRRRMLNKNSK